MLTDEEYDEQEAEAERIDEVTADLIDALNAAGVQFADAVDGDIYVEWYLSDLMEFCQQWRSEIEELG